jgi:eukaryotic-like serine/threonine-protein kinase
MREPARKPAIATHPNPGELERFARGEMTDGSRLSELETHLESCDTCRSILLEVEPDPFMLKVAALTTSGAAPIQEDSRKLVPGFEILEEIGRGGAGVVYHARHRGMGRDVALKVIRSSGNPTPAELLRFHREAAILARLRHPHIVDIYDTGEQAGVPFIAMEYVAGATLANWLQQRPLEARAAAQILVQLADAVAYAHSQGIVHRDLKPQNVLLQENGARRIDNQMAFDTGSVTGVVPKIADFGLSKLIKEESTQTRTGEPLGTPSYMAPEQISGSTREIGPATDVYGLGAILYECLTGRPPFRGSTAIETMRLVQSQDVVPIDRIRPGISMDLTTICSRCLEKEPTRRFASCQALRDDLWAYLQGRPISSRPRSIPYRVRLWVRRNPARTAMGAIVVLSVLGFIGVTTWHQLLLRQQRELAHQQYAKARTAIWAILNQAQRFSALEIPKLNEMVLGQTQESLKLFEELQGIEHSPQSEVDLARIQMRAGTSLVSMGKTEEGEALLAEAATKFEDLFKNSPLDPAITSDYIDGVTKLSIARTASGKHADAIDQLKRVVPLVVQQAQADPQDFRSQNAVGWVCISLGNAYLYSNDFAAAAEEYQRSVDFRKKAVELAPDNLDVRTALADSMINLAQASASQGKKEVAIQYLREAIAVFDEALRKFPKNEGFRVSKAVSHLNLSNHLVSTEDLEGAVATCGLGIDAIRELVAKEPNHQTARDTLSMLHANRGMYLCALQRHRESFPDWSEAVRLSAGFDNNMAHYCKTMWIRSLVTEGNQSESDSRLQELEAEKLSPLNLYRLSAAYGYAATRIVGTSTELEMKKRAYIERSLTILRELANQGEFKEDQANVNYILESEDFSLVRDSVGLDAFKLLLAGEGTR